jgi:single-strand DNA-binding protein
MNVVVLRGVLSRAPEVRSLSGGGTAWQVDISTVVDGGSASVPLSWVDPPSPPRATVGDEVVVLGSVRRRFFRSGGSTQSRTEVVVLQLVKASSARSVERLLASAGDRIAG